MGGLSKMHRAETISDETREQVYGFLAALFSHPDEGRWGRVLNPQAQREIIAAADAIRAAARGLDYPLGEDELSADHLDLRSLILELCQPLEHLKAEYERVLCGRRWPGCSPYELEHREETGEYQQLEKLAEFATLYRAFGLYLDEKVPERPDHVACELEFMYCLLAQRRLSGQMALVDAEAARSACRCDLAQRNFFGDHLAGWLGPFGAALRECPSGGYFEPLGRFLAAWLPLERYCLGVAEGLREPGCRPEGLAVGG